MSIYDSNLEKNKVNYFPLTPISFMRERKNSTSLIIIIYEKKKFTWSETFLRCKKLLSL